MKKLSDASWMIHEGMAKTKIKSISALAKRLGLTRPTMSRKVNCPSTFTIYEVQALGKLFQWTDEELGSFLREIV